MRCTDMIKFVLFDLDDTLLDFHKAEAAAIKKTFSHIGIPTDDGTVARYSEINASQWRRLEKGEISREQVLLERFDILFDELGVRIPSEMAQKTYEYLLGVGHYFIDGAPEVSECAARQIPTVHCVKRYGKCSGQTAAQCGYGALF